MTGGGGCIGIGFGAQVLKSEPNMESEGLQSQYKS